MLPSNDMNGNNPVSSLYKMPLFLLANAPKAKMLAIDSSLFLSNIMLGLVGWTAVGCTYLSYPASLDTTERCGWISWIRAASITCTGASAITWTGVVAILGVVLWLPF
jgi:hypothetical protein